MTPAQLVEAAREMAPGQTISFHPLCGGISPDLAWQSLRLFAGEALPALREEGLMAAG
jgi:prephenate dehydrogenase